MALRAGAAPEQPDNVVQPFVGQRLALGTGMHLAQACRAEYPRPVRYVLWILAEFTIIASDVPEVIGTAFALPLHCNCNFQTVIAQLDPTDYQMDRMQRPRRGDLQHAVGCMYA